MTPTTRRLIAVRGLRSLGQGVLVVDFALYLRGLHWSAVAISAVLSLGLAVGAALMAVAGPASDRLGRRGFLIGYELALLLAAAVALVTAAPGPLAVAAVVGGFGRGANGAAGPFAPVEQAWLAEGLAPDERGHVFSVNAGMGFSGMAVGALLAALVPVLGQRFPFVVVMAASALCLAVLVGLREVRGPRAAEAEPVVRQRENGLVRRLVVANALNGIGIGMTGPLIAYWFAVRFGRGPEAIGPLLAASFALTAAASLGAGRLTRRHGVVRTVVGLRAAGVGMLLALPFAPGFATAAVLYVGRSVVNRSTIGARSALSVGLVRAERRGFAVSVGAVSSAVPRAVGPLLTGVMFQHGWLALPFVLGAVFQVGYLVAFYGFREFG